MWQITLCITVQQQLPQIANFFQFQSTVILHLDGSVVVLIKKKKTKKKKSEECEQACLATFSRHSSSLPTSLHFSSLGEAAALCPQKLSTTTITGVQRVCYYGERGGGGGLSQATTTCVLALSPFFVGLLKSRKHLNISYSSLCFSQPLGGHKSSSSSASYFTF